MEKKSLEKKSFFRVNNARISSAQYSRAARMKGLRSKQNRPAERREMPVRVCEWHKRIQFATNKMGLVMKDIAIPRNTVAYITPL